MKIGKVKLGCLTLVTAMALFQYFFVVSYPIDLGGGYVLNYDYRDDKAVLDKKSTIIIFGHVFNHVFNHRYIAVKQRPRAEIRWCSIKDPYDICQKAFNESTFFQYWIIDKGIGEKGSKMGPFTVDEYRQKLTELGIETEEFLAITEDQK